ncbi:MAG: DNA-protecting protein DprA [Phycisphaerae bacterium]|nr:DNA-protecting protein DprA [Phycisphaerae bacterium]
MMLLLDRFGPTIGSSCPPVAQLSSVLGIPACQANSIRRSILDAPVEAELQELTLGAARLLARGEPGYPKLLDATSDPPELLWVRGDERLLASEMVAIVGSRRATSYGLNQSRIMAAGLSRSGLCIVSGGARGIDAAAHRAVLVEGGPMACVMGSGLSRAYPPEHAALFDRIVDGGGCLLSEWPMNRPPRPVFFPMRNRIISGMAIGVLVIEAAIRSGALITARQANDHGREVLGVPGRIDSTASAGVHRAIRDGWMTLATSPEDVLEQLSTVAWSSIREYKNKCPLSESGSSG